MRLPAPVVGLVDGSDLAGKVGQTISLITTDSEGWPRLALLSVGEVLTTTGTDLRLALHAGSGTTAALTQSGRALLNTVLDATSYRIKGTFSRFGPDDGPLAFFDGVVVSVDEDRAPYAELTSGITYRLYDEKGVVERWTAQVELLRTVTT